MNPIYRRILLKLSGEGLMGDKLFGVSAEVVDRLAAEIKTVYDKGVEICLVIGGGNIFRGAKEATKGMNRTSADQIGMMATVMNALFIQSALENIGVPVRVMSGLCVPAVCETYVYRRALEHLKKKRIVIFAGGTGNPYFTTDTGAALRAVEMQCDVLMKATQVDGVYDSDPRTNPAAQRYAHINYDEVLRQHLAFMDTAAIALASENNLPIVVFNQSQKNSLTEVVSGKGKFTIIDNKQGK